MHIIVCLDDRDGMLFNRRRQSSDRAVCDHILTRLQQPLWVSPYSAKLFADHPDQIFVAEDPLADCPEDGICFLENIPLEPYTDRITKVTVYRWNRHYPADRKFPLAAVLVNWQLGESGEFAGNSHERITWEVYER